MPSPLYTALIESVPTARAVVVHAALRDDSTATAEQPAMAVPFELNATVPVGVGGPAGVIVAVKVTDLPAVDGFRLDTSVVVEAALTFCDSVALVLAR